MKTVTMTLKEFQLMKDLIANLEKENKELKEEMEKKVDAEVDRNLEFIKNKVLEINEILGLG